MPNVNNLIKNNSELYAIGVPLKACKALHAADIYEMKTLRKMSYNDLIKIPGLGDQGIKEIAHRAFTGWARIK